MLVNPTQIELAPWEPLDGIIPPKELERIRSGKQPNDGVNVYWTNHDPVNGAVMMAALSGTPPSAASVLVSGGEPPE